MRDIVADLHLHSKYSRAVSPQMVLSVMSNFAKQKGIDLITASDFTHPLWFKEIKNELEEVNDGIYCLKSGEKVTKFLLSTEISCIYTQKGKGRRVHNLIFAPNLQTVEKINKEMIRRGFNLGSDGRPIIGLSSKNLLQLIMEVDERCFLIPCHIWTPWFGIYGQMSGFESLSEAFEDLASYVYGIETGLSSDPQMNWQIEELKTRSILSFSDAHSPAKIGREATVFVSKDENLKNDFSFNDIRLAIMQKNPNLKIGYTIEFYPEEGKYHFSGHRNCNVTMTPLEQAENGGICPVCKRTVTDGVLRRVDELSSVKIEAKKKENDEKLVWYLDPEKNHPPFVKIVPLIEIIAESQNVMIGSKKVKEIYDNLILNLGSEFDILLKIEISKIKELAGERIADGIEKVRQGNIVIKPGYDGVFGIVKIWDQENKSHSNITKEVKDISQLEINFWNFRSYNRNCRIWNAYGNFPFYSNVFWNR